MGSAWMGAWALLLTLISSITGGRLPHATLAGMMESGRPLDAADGVTSAVQDGEAVVVEVGSGRYEFVYDAGEF